MRITPLLIAPMIRVIIASLFICTLAGAESPNVILFIVDDLGWQDTSVPFHDEVTPFNQRYRTPNVERLAARGMRFTDAYAAAPVCTPSRVAIMTGLSPARSHVTYWTLHKNTDTSKTRDDIAAPDWNMNGLSAGDLTLPRLLQRAGYRTIHVGKAHFGAIGTTGADPRRLGFDVNIAGHGPGGPGSFYGVHHFTVAGRQGKTPGDPPAVWDVPGLEAYHGQDIYLTEALAIEASKAITDAVRAEEPFYLNFAPYAVHAPIMPNKRYLDGYADLDAREAAYATMIQTYDAALGTLMDLLDELEIADETVIIFTSDNGGLSAHARGPAPTGEPRHTHNAPLRSGKGSSYEGGTRVPLIVSWPGVTPPGALCREQVIGTDLFATILEMCGVDPPAADEPSVDGLDFTPTLRGAPPGASRILGWHMPHQWGASGPGIEPFTSIRLGDLKLIYFHAGRRFELYDLGDDASEVHDLTSSRPGAVAALAGEMSRWLDERGGQLSIDLESSAPIESPVDAAMAMLNSKERPMTKHANPSAEDRAAAAGWGQGAWIDQHQAIREAARTINPRIVLIGDSITQSWGGPGRAVSAPGGQARQAWLDPMGPVLNAGISGDRTQHVAWRLAHGLLEDADPDVIVLMIGTNNLPTDAPEDIAAGIESICDMLAALRPETPVLLIAPPPRGERVDEEMRESGRTLAADLKAMAEQRDLAFLDAATIFVQHDGSADATLMADDWVHLRPEGYEALGDAIARRIADTGD